MSEQQVIKISVRNLVEFILREGDIDNRIASGLDKEAMQLGSRIHRKIQRQMGSNYRAEVSLKYIVECDGFQLQIEGRADGIIEEQGGTIIDEIKGVLKELIYITEPKQVHLAQAKCYAYIYGIQQGLDEICVQMTYCNMDTEEIKRFREPYSMKDLETWFFDVVHQYEKWADFQVKWKNIRNKSIQHIVFPFHYREGQKNLVASVYRTILRKKKLFIQAPTGVGKTMATIFPAVKSIGEGLGDKIFYLTAKTITRTVAEQAFMTLKEQNLQYKVITLTAKDKICFQEEKECNPDMCPYAKGHYDRVNEAVFYMITTTSDMSREAMEQIAKKFQVCPFELSLDVSVWVDAIICDYNYLFDPNAHLRRFFSEGIKGEYLFLVDEAHNLVERGREMYSATLYKEEFLVAKHIVKNQDLKLERRLSSCNKLLLELKRECEKYKLHSGIGHFSLKLMNLMVEMERYLEETVDMDARKQILELYFHVRAFLNIYDRLDEHYVIYTELEKNGNFKLKLFCVNPAVNIQECIDCGNSTVFFSATLLPISYYKQLLSTEPENYAIYAESPFRPEHRLLLLGNDVSTKYSMRGFEMYEKMAHYLLSVVRRKEGNYLVFFPSYRMMEDVFEIFLSFYEYKQTKDIQCLIQKQNMNEQCREDFLAEFERERTGSLIGFCVMGGIFSEGIDLVEERLIGAFIIGTGLPQVCSEREILKQYFEQRGMDGFAYAYLYPGMNKVLQSAGRVIRTDSDRGIVLLLDERFKQRQYRDIFPREWNLYHSCDVNTASKYVEEFWKQFENETATICELPQKL